MPLGRPTASLMGKVKFLFLPYFAKSRENVWGLGARRAPFFRYSSRDGVASAKTILDALTTELDVSIH